MADKSVLSAPAEIIPFLRRMELARDDLIEVVRFADHERSFCTNNDIRGFDLITVNAKAARALRDTCCGERWEKDETDNQGGICNPHLGIRVIACNFDENAGNRLVDPMNRVLKGEASRTNARCNATGWLPGLPDIPAQEGAEIVTWVLGIYSQKDEPLRAEISLPVSFSRGRYTRLKPRIILLSGQEVDPAGRQRTPDRQGPLEVVDIAIKRK